MLYGPQAPPRQPPWYEQKPAAQTSEPQSLSAAQATPVAQKAVVVWVYRPCEFDVLGAGAAHAPRHVVCPPVSSATTTHTPDLQSPLPPQLPPMPTGDPTGGRHDPLPMGWLQLPL